MTGCLNSANNAACTDGNACTGPDVCAGGTCSTPALSCDDNNTCTTDTCNVATGCAHANVPNGSLCSNNTGRCVTGTCTPGVCGDGVVESGLGETCDDGNTTSGDGCSATCQAEGCADGTREGNLTAAVSPNIAECTGNWTGWVGGSNAATLCSTGFHVCTYTAADVALMRSIPYATEANGAGCWAINAATNQGGNGCGQCRNQEDDLMAGMGGQCLTVNPNGSASCTGAASNINVGNNNNNNRYCNRDAQHPMAWITGVLCCKN